MPSSSGLRAAKQTYRKWMIRLNRGVFAFCAVLLAAMTLLISWRVFTRYVLHASSTLSEQASLLIIIYFGFFGAAAAYRENLHIGVELLHDRLPSAWRVRAAICLDAIVAALSVFMIVCGTLLSG